MLSIRKWFSTLSRRLFHRTTKQWKGNTLVVGPAEPVDGDSVACTKALINHLRSKGLTAYTLPVLAMYDQIDWILTEDDLHPSIRGLASSRLTTPSLQVAYDTLLAAWHPDEIVVVDGCQTRLGFDTRGVPAYCIDHHVPNPPDKPVCENSFVEAAASAGCLLIQHFGIYDPVLVVSILTDTYWLRRNHPAQAIKSLALLQKKGGLSDELLEEIQRKLQPAKDPAILYAARACKLKSTTTMALAIMDTADPQLHREAVALLSYYWRNICVVRGDGKIAFRSQSRDLRPLAAKYGGGGHPHMAAGRLSLMSAEAQEQLWQDFLDLVTVPVSVPCCTRCVAPAPTDETPNR